MAIGLEHRPPELAYVEVWDSDSRARSLDELAIFQLGNRETWQAIGREVEGMRKLENDWDGDGAVEPSGAVIDAAKGLLAVLAACPGWEVPSRVTAMPNGTISFEWDMQGGRAEVEIEKPDLAIVSFIAPGAEVAELMPVSLTDLRRRLMAIGAS